MGQDQNIIAIDTGYVPPGRNQECADRLRELLERAEKGEINGIMVVAISARDGGAYDYLGSCWGGSARNNVHSMLGGLRALEHRFIAVNEV